jgi:hypothetical protein
MCEDIVGLVELQDSGSDVTTSGAGDCVLDLDGPRPIPQSAKKEDLVNAYHSSNDSLSSTGARR